MEGGVAWCEVHAHCIPEAVEAGFFEAEATKCAQPMCDRCVERERKWAIQELDHELMRSAADADTLRQMVPAESHCDEQAKWALLTQCVRKTVAAKALELGLCAEAAKPHADAVLDGEPVLKFGKHKGRTLSAAVPAVARRVQLQEDGQAGQGGAAGRRSRHGLHHERR